MLRSLSYAAETGLRNADDATPQLEAWINEWEQQARAALRAFYKTHGRGPTFAEMGHEGQGRIPGIPSASAVRRMFGSVGAAFQEGLGGGVQVEEAPFPVEAVDGVGNTGQGVAGTRPQPVVCLHAARSRPAGRRSAEADAPGPDRPVQGMIRTRITPRVVAVEPIRHPRPERAR